MRIESSNFPVLFVTVGESAQASPSSVIHTFKERGEALDAMNAVQEHNPATLYFKVEAIALFRL